ncbi:MAG: hypothetical protein ABIT71_00705 [Vicinamibacteraceae bacterium]
MPESNDVLSQAASEERRAELRAPASTLGSVRSRLIGGTDFALLNYAPTSLYGQSRSRMLVGARISVRLATATLDAIVRGRVVRASLTGVTDGVPHYELAVSLDDAIDWSPEPAPAASSFLDAVPVAVPVAVPLATPSQAE